MSSVESIFHFVPMYFPDPSICSVTVVALRQDLVAHASLQPAM